MKETTPGWPFECRSEPPSRLADPLRRPTRDLRLDSCLIHHRTAVVHHHIPIDRHKPGIGINRHRCGVAAIAEGRRFQLVRHGDVQFDTFQVGRRAP